MESSRELLLLVFWEKVIDDGGDVDVVVAFRRRFAPVSIFLYVWGPKDPSDGLVVDFTIPAGLVTRWYCKRSTEPNDFMWLLAVLGCFHPPSNGGNGALRDRRWVSYEVL